MIQTKTNLMQTIEIFNKIEQTRYTWGQQNIYIDLSWQSSSIYWFIYLQPTNLEYSRVRGELCHHSHMVDSKLHCPCYKNNWWVSVAIAFYKLAEVPWAKNWRIYYPDSICCQQVGPPSCFKMAWVKNCKSFPYYWSWKCFGTLPTIFQHFCPG